MTSFFNDDQNSQSTSNDEKLPLIIKFGTEEVEIQENELTDGLTLRQLVIQQAENLGVDPDRITTFRNEGSVISGDSIVKVGNLYSIAINAESKG